MRIQMLATCMVDSLFPRAGEAMRRILAEAGVEVGLADQATCCGQPLFNGGFHDQARLQALRVVDALSDLPDPIVVPSGSCAAMIRHGYLQLLSDDPDRQEAASRLARRTYEFSEFLVDVVQWFPARRECPEFIYHASCHLHRGLGVKRQPLVLLEALLGKDPDTLPEECCGFGGLFSIEQPELSDAMLQRRIAQISSSHARRVVGGDVGCLMHIEGALRRAGSDVRCVHLAQALVGDWSGLA